VQRLESAPVAGRVVIEADPATLSHRPDADFLLEPGDEILVPKRPNSVAVMGQVLSPGSLAFVSGGSAKDYIRQSGGFAQGADEKRAFIVLPNGVARPLRRSFGWTDQSEVTPGSVIVVPRDVAPFTGLALTERITSILSNLALSAAALVTINR
jgi:protein involved in polysaccharide export with SLBB domain